MMWSCLLETKCTVTKMSNLDENEVGRKRQINIKQSDNPCSHSNTYETNRKTNKQSSKQTHPNRECICQNRLLGAEEDQIRSNVFDSHV